MPSRTSVWSSARTSEMPTTVTVPAHRSNWDEGFPSARSRARTLSGGGSASPGWVHGRADPGPTAVRLDHPLPLPVRPTLDRPGLPGRGAADAVGGEGARRVPAPDPLLRPP